MIIHLFGSTTPSAKAFRNILIAKGYKKIKEYSRKNLGPYYEYCDMNKPDEFKYIDDIEPSYIISFAPIWKTSKFLCALSKIKPDFFNSVQKILVCSSSSVITKKYSFNIFDQNLSKSLEESEDSLIELSENLKIEIRIVRPTLIYGSCCGFKDKNFSKIIQLMRFLPFLVLPRNSGYRQPISCYELGNVFFSLLKNKYLKKEINSRILIGGDKIISFNEMLIALKNSTNKEDKARNCFFIFLPDKLFIFLISPIFVLSRKNYEALLRIFANLSHFTQQHQLTNNKSKVFPVNNI